MNVEKLQKMAGAVRTGGKGSVRRKKKTVHKTTSTDDKKLENILKRFRANIVSQIEEVNIYQEDKVIQFLNPKVQAAVPANTWVVSGTPQTKTLEEVYKGMDVNELISRLGGADKWKKIAEQLQNETGAGEGAAPAAMATIQEDDDDVPELVAGETFEAVAAEEGKKS